MVAEPLARRLEVKWSAGCIALPLGILDRFNLGLFLALLRFIYADGFSLSNDRGQAVD